MSGSSLREKAEKKDPPSACLAVEEKRDGSLNVGTKGRRGAQCRAHSEPKRLVSRAFLIRAWKGGK